MGEYKKKAFDSALDQVKQLISLATGILALTATFLKDILGILKPVPDGKTAAIPHLGLLIATWASMLISIFLGLLAHGAITGALEEADALPEKSVTIYKGNIRWLGILQWLLFFIGVILMAVFSILAL